MKHHHGIVSSSLLTVAGLLGVAAAGLSLATGVTPCQLVGACTSAVATACDSTKETAKEVTLVSAEGKDCSTKTDCSSEAKAVAVSASDCGTKSACDGDAKAVAVSDSGCKSACEGEAKAVAVNASECKTACEGETVTLVAATNAGDCASKCSGEAKAVAVNASECKAACEGEAKATTVAASSGCASACSGEGKAVAASDSACKSDCSMGATATTVAASSESCSGECAEGDVKSLPTAVHAFNADCPFSGNAAKADVVASYHGMKVSFCCNGCKGRFEKADADKQASLVANVVKPINSTCCDKPVDASTMAVVQGFPVAFCKAACGDMVTHADAAKQRAFVANKIKTVNDSCCKTPAAEAKMVGFHHGKAVALCNDTCAEHFNAATSEQKDAWIAKLASDSKECVDGCEKTCCSTGA